MADDKNALVSGDWRGPATPRPAATPQRPAFGKARELHLRSRPASHVEEKQRARAVADAGSAGGRRYDGGGARRGSAEDHRTGRDRRWRDRVAGARSAGAAQHYPAPRAARIYLYALGRGVRVDDRARAGNATQPRTGARRGIGRPAPRYRQGHAAARIARQAGAPLRRRRGGPARAPAARLRCSSRCGGHARAGSRRRSASS